MNRKYSPEMRERALRMLAETRPSHPTMMSAVRHVAGVWRRNRLQLALRVEPLDGEDVIRDC